MTPRQRLIVGVLVVANAAVILAIVALVTRPGVSPVPSFANTPSPASSPSSSPAPVLPPTDCRWRATQLLAQAGLGGTVVITSDGSLEFDIPYTLEPDQMVDEAAQTIWTAFDVALALREYRCVAYSQVRVTILAHGDQVDIQINAAVSTADLVAYGAGALSEDEFIDTVIYSVHSEREPP
jgi:hypothetical protein